MSLLISRFFTSAALMIWGTVLAWFYFSGKVQSYLHPNFQIYTAISGILLILMATVVLIFGFPDTCNEQNCSHTHGKLTVGRVLALCVIVLPVFIASSMSPDQFGATTIINRGYVDSIAQLPGAQKSVPQTPYVEPALPGESPSSAQPVPDGADSYMKKNDKGQIIIQTIDMLYAADEPSMRKDFAGKTVEVVGQFMPAKVQNPTGKNFNLVRMYIVCCAADARPVSLTVQAPKEESFTDMQWVKVVGKAAFPRQGDKFTPLIVAESVTPCDPPDEKFLN